MVKRFILLIGGILYMMPVRRDDDLLKRTFIG